ncbi:MAG: 4Fe-4S cluster-binding domain-containing protein [Methanosarcinales archaeon]|nr:4Fe-4S cluster-binding domain-containing protein [Methanosarcinales archaeon]
MAGRCGHCPNLWFRHPHCTDHLAGIGGSGTVFLANCNLRCVYCQNYDISHKGKGNPITEEQLADSMLWIQRIGCHNINLVTPTHYTPNLVKAVAIAAPIASKNRCVDTKKQRFLTIFIPPSLFYSY